MNLLQRALVEKAGHDYGFEYVLSGEGPDVSMASARHPIQVSVSADAGRLRLRFSSLRSDLLNGELKRSFPELCGVDGSFAATDQDVLANLLRRAAELGHALPNQAAQDFETALQNELSSVPAELRGTEVERLVRQRVGQDAFRRAMMDYWGGACAVTGVAIPEVLRASHAKPWADCASDAERLDVFNGFLLSANLDALFDRFLISFADDGSILVSHCILPAELARLGIHEEMALRWRANDHLSYLQYHRAEMKKRNQ